MKAITLYQPWASLVALGAKKIETRSWKTDYRGPLAIHASKKVTRFNRLFAFHSPCREFLDADPLFKEWGDLPLGKILCVVDLVDCVPADTITPADPERLFGDFGRGRFAWILASLRKLESPIFAIGHQGLWEWKDPRL